MQQKLFVQIFDLVTENSFLAKMNKPIIMKNTKKNKKHGTNLFRGNSEKVFVLCDMFYALKDIFFEKTAKICLSKKLGVSVSFYMTTAELFSFAPTSCDHQSEVG